ADANRHRGHFDELVVGDELHGIFERELDRWGQQDRIVLTGRTDVRELLGFDRIHHKIVLAAMNADDHALVKLLARAHEHASALLEVEERVGHRFTVLVAHEHAVVTVGDLTLHRCEAVENMAHETGAASECHELALESDEASSGYPIFQAGPAVADRHVAELRAASSQRLHDGTLVPLVNVDGESLVRLMNLAIDELRQNLRPGNGELVALSAHVLDENGQVQLTAAGDAHDIGLVRVLDTQRHVALELPLQTLAQLAAGHVFAFATCQGRGVDLEVHGQRRLVDANRGQTLRGFRIAHRQADIHVLDTGDRNDIAG